MLWLWKLQLTSSFLEASGWRRDSFCSKVLSKDKEFVAKIDMWDQGRERLGHRRMPGGCHQDFARRLRMSQACCALTNGCSLTPTQAENLKYIPTRGTVAYELGGVDDVVSACSHARQSPWSELWRCSLLWCNKEGRMGENATEHVRWSRWCRDDRHHRGLLLLARANKGSYRRLPSSYP